MLVLESVHPSKVAVMKVTDHGHGNSSSMPLVWLLAS